ncbi:MAG: type II toxin-antitoxin system Phd/YefM family antitoxin [Bacteroidota bacterium]
MNRINFARDIQPLSAFRKSAAQLVDQVQESGRPLILTRNGRSAVVVLDVNTYERMIEHSELLEDLHLAREQVREGKTVAQDDVLDLLTARQAAT